MRTRLSGGVAGVPGAIRGPYAAMGDPSTRGTAVRRPKGVHAGYTHERDRETSGKAVGFKPVGTVGVLELLVSYGFHP